MVKVTSNVALDFGVGGLMPTWAKEQMERAIKAVKNKCFMFYFLKV